MRIMENFEKEFAKLIEENTLEKVKENVYLTKYQKYILEENNIPYTTCNTMNELLFLLSDITDDEELESVARQIEEFHYYNETKK